MSDGVEHPRPSTVRRDAGLYGYERALARRGLWPVAGADEAGRGACAGPLVVAAVTLPAAFAAFAGGQSILGRQHLSVSLGEPGVTRAVIGSALYLAVIGLLGLGLGALLRNAAGGIAALFGLLYGLPLAAGFLPGNWATDVAKYLPANVGQAVTTVDPDPTLLQPWTGFAVLCAYAAVLLGISAARMRRGDA